MDINQANAILADNAAAEPADQAALEQEQPQEQPEQEAPEQASSEPQEGEQEPSKPEPQHVPLAVHIRERQRFQQERQQWEQQARVVNERLQQLFAAQQAQQQKADPAPDKETDPIGYNIWLNEQTAKKLEQVEQQRTVEQQQRYQYEQQQAAVKFVADKVMADEQKFVASKPDYKDAIQHVRDLKHREYMALGMTEEQASAKLQQDAWALSIYAAQNNISAAEYAYQIAEALGYRPKTPQGTKVLEMRSEGMRTGVSGGAGGRKGAPTFADLAAMSNDEFAKLTAGDNWEKMMRG